MSVACVCIYVCAVAKKSQAAEVGALSRVNFVGLLKKEAAQKQAKAQKLQGGDGLSVSACTRQDDSDDQDSDGASDRGSDDGEEQAKKAGWGALKDSMVEDRELALKVYLLLLC